MEIIDVDITNELKQSYLDYAMDVIVDRALPDARDGLKPVHRRSLYGMYKMGLRSDGKTIKSARVVGDIIGKYHPHGDSAVYMTIARMAQDFVLRYPLIVGQGNFGSIDGDKPAAMRYTEIKLKKISDEILEDLDKETVDFKYNYDNSFLIPDYVLPTKIPNLLINGSSGIAVGLATNIPSHNITEVLTAVIELIKEPNLTIPQLMNFIQGPDFATGATIYGRSGIYSAYTTGKGSIITRAKYEIGNTTSGHPAIYITEIPYGVVKSELVSKISDLVNDKVVDGIANVTDLSSKDIKIEIELKKDQFPDVIINNLFKHSQLQSSFPVNMVALVNGRPKTLNLKECLECFIGHRREVVTRRYAYLLRQSRDKAHILEGLLVAQDNLDEIVSLIRNSDTRETAKNALLSKKWPANSCDELLKRCGDVCRPLQTAKEDGYFEGYYKLSEIQVDKILDMRLAQLVKIVKQDILDEYNEIYTNIVFYLKVLSSVDELHKIIIQECEDLINRYGDERRTEIIDAEGSIEVEDLITPRDVVVTISKTGYVKYIPLTEYALQGRGGTGRKNTELKEDDFVEQIFVANVLDKVLCFTNLGQVFPIKVYQFPEGSRVSKGKALVNYLPLREGELVSYFLPVKEFDDEHYVLIATKNGFVKKTKLSEFAKINVKGKRAFTFKSETDSLIGVDITDGNSDILLVTKNGYVIKFNEKIDPSLMTDDESNEDLNEDLATNGEQDNSLDEDSELDFKENVRPMGCTAGGNRGIKLREGDEVVSMIVPKSKEGCYFTATKNGYGRKTLFSSVPRRLKRGGKGVSNFRQSMLDKKGSIVTALEVDNLDQIMLSTSLGNMIRINLEDIAIQSRTASGIRVVRLNKEGDSLSAVCRVVCPNKEDADKIDAEALQEAELDDVMAEKEDNENNSANESNDSPSNKD